VPILLSATAWIVGILFILPVLWMVLTSFHSEPDAAKNPPALFAPLSLEGYKTFFDSGPWPPLLNSLTASVLSTVLVLLLAFPAAYALSIKPVKKWTDVLFFFLSTKMLPVVAGLLPLYLFAQAVNVLDNIWYLLILYTSMNLPIVVWMLRSFLAEVPVEMLEAAQLDGAGLVRTLRSIIAPVGPARDRRGRVDLVHLQLERAALRAGAHRYRGPDRAGVPHRLRDQPGPVPRQGLCRVVGRVAAGAHRRVRGPGQARAGLSLGAVR
jgi:ABC-type spermidine/putrescine transport system permease subunit I